MGLEDHIAYSPDWEIGGPGIGETDEKVGNLIKERIKVLQEICRHSDPVSVQEIKQKTGMSESEVMKYIDIWDMLKHIKKENRDESVYVELTEKGKARCDKYDT